jgi:hypothetical protein
MSRAKAEVNQARIVNDAEKPQIPLLTGRGVNSIRGDVPLLEFPQKVQWSLWQGKVGKALDRLKDLDRRINLFTDTYLRFTHLKKPVRQFYPDIANNRGLIPTYGQRRRERETISTAFAESTVNQVISKRFVKKQSMQWTKRGAHLLLQTRVKTLNNE